jgi:hypothetical protein
MPIVRASMLFQFKSLIRRVWRAPLPKGQNDPSSNRLAERRNRALAAA